VAVTGVLGTQETVKTGVPVVVVLDAVPRKQTQAVRERRTKVATVVTENQARLTLKDTVAVAVVLPLSVKTPHRVQAEMVVPGFRRQSQVAV